jgi:DNA (cytosine-5)-methyltransferase 1
LIYGSVCSGIEAASVAWHPLGWRPAFFSDIEDFPRRVLKHHFPDVPLHGRERRKGETLKEYGDACGFQTIQAGSYGPVDLLVGGTPCQDFSVAGLRAGLAGERGNLTLEYLRLAGRLRPRWLVWENVPGVLSSDGGRALGAFLGGLAELGYGFAWRVLDAQYVRVDGFGRAVPQRRRRVFVVGYLGDWRRAAAVLFERESLCGNPPPRREAGEGVAPTISARTQGGGGLGTDFDCDGGLIYAPEIMAQALTSKIAKGSSGPAGDEHHHLVALAFAMRGREEGNVPEISGDVVSTLRGASGGSSRDMIAYGIRSDAERAGEALTPSADAAGHVRLRNPGMGVYENLSPTLDAARPHSVATPWAVRRLTPRECERLQGFPDDFTLVPVGKKLAADGPRYKALGNSMAVNVMRWIGMRISRVEAMGIQFGEAA